jgi:two-component system phosphate regulon response regulator PhoB
LADRDPAKHRILVIEDDPALLKFLDTALSKAGYDVALARDGLDGLVQIDRAEPKPDLLVVDVMMPELDGLSLVRALKTRVETRNIPVVFVTAKSDARTVAEGISAGARFFVTKPFVIDDLLAKVRKAIRG